MKVRRLAPEEMQGAVDLALRVFMRFEAPDYGPQGVESFRQTLAEPSFVQMLTVYGALEGETLLGMLATRSGGAHISLFFVEEAHQRRGIGRTLFTAALLRAPQGEMTVNASPYAVPVYERLGFTATDTEQMRDGIRYTPMRYGGSRRQGGVENNHA